MVDRTLILRKLSMLEEYLKQNYDRVDEEIVIGILRKRLGDFAKFKNAIIKLIKRID